MKVHLDANAPMVRELARVTFPAYAGRQFSICVTERVTLSGLYWDGGSRDTYAAFTLTDPPRGVELPTPEYGSLETPVVSLRPGFGIAEHTIFRGKDLGLTFHIHPADAVALLPAPVELGEPDRLVLAMHAQLTSAGRKSVREREQIGEDVYVEAQARLRSRGFLTKGNAITPSGRNAIQGARYDF